MTQITIPAPSVKVIPVEDSDYTITQIDKYLLVAVKGLTAPRTITIPSAVSGYREITVKDQSGTANVNTITVDVDLVSNGTGFSIFKANTNGWYEVDLTTSFKNTAVAPHEVYVCINRDTGSGFNGLPIRSNRMRLGPSGGSDEKPLTLKTNVYLYAGWRIKAAWWTDDSGVVMKQYNSPDTGISDVPSARMIIRKYSEANEQSGN